MTGHLKTTICTILLALYSSAALGQSEPFPSGSDPLGGGPIGSGVVGSGLVGSGLVGSGLISDEANLPIYRGPLPDSSSPGLYRLPPPSQPGLTTLVGGLDQGSMNLGGPSALPRKTTSFTSNCDGCGKSECGCGPRWIMSADLLWMSRSRVNSQTMISTPVGGLAPTESFNARELMFDARAGYRASWGYDLLDGRAVELVSFSVFDQPANANVVESDMFFSFHGLSPTVGTDAYTVDYVSNLHNGELNWWLGEAWGIRPMMGVRWIRVREEFSILDTTDTSWDAYSTMRNDLVGAQIGFKTRLWNGGNWFRVEAAMKSGVYHNNIDYQAYVVDELGASQGRIDRTPSATSFAGELTVSAVLQFSPNVAMRFGYHGLWMSAIGLAPNQANRSDIATGSGTDYLGSLAYQGGFVGLEASW